MHFQAHDANCFSVCVMCIYPTVYYKIRLYSSNHETLHVSSCGAEAVATVCVPTWNKRKSIRLTQLCTDCRLLLQWADCLYIDNIKIYHDSQGYLLQWKITLSVRALKRVWSDYYGYSCYGYASWIMVQVGYGVGVLVYHQTWPVAFGW